MPVEIAYPWPPASLSPNAKRRKHWRTYQPQANSYRRLCWALTCEGASVRTELSKIESITFHPPDRRRRDDDSIIGQFKHGRDGIADALGVDDHSFRPAYQFGDVVKGGKIVVVLS